MPAVAKGADGLPKLLFCTPSTTFAAVLEMLATTCKHRVYVVEEGTRRPNGVVTATDCLRLLFPPASHPHQH